MGRRRTESGREGEKVPRNAANARERTRMRVLSKAFGRLKLTLPWVPPDTKVGKDSLGENHFKKLTSGD